MNRFAHISITALALLILIGVDSSAATYIATILPVPAGLTPTDARGGDNSYEVGRAGVNDQSHAILWGPGGPVDLHPTGFTRSFAYDVSSGFQVGWASGPTTNDLERVLKIRN